MPKFRLVGARDGDVINEIFEADGWSDAHEQACLLAEKTFRIDPEDYLLGEPDDSEDRFDMLSAETDGLTLEEVEQPAPNEALLAHYRRLHDGLSDMIEGGRLTEADIPDDYHWLVEMLAQAGELEA